MFSNTKLMKENIPCIKIKNNNVIGVSEGLCHLVDFKASELLGQPVDKFLIKLKSSFNISDDMISVEQQGFIFSRHLDVINVKISLRKENDITIACFIEIPNSRLKDIFLYAYKMCDDNLSGMAIYSASDLTLLKANEKYIKYWNAPLDNIDYCIGKSLKKIMPDWETSQQSEVWNNVISTGKSLKLKEFKHINCTHSKYCDLTITPIFINEKLKYIIVNNIDVTDRVESRINIEKQSKLISEQNKLLETIIDNMSEDLIVIDAEGNHLITNKSAANRAKNIELQSAGDVYCNFTFTDLEGKDIPLEDMPVSHVLRGEKILNKELIMKSPTSATYFSTHGIPILDNNNKLIAGVICCRDITKEVLEKQQLRRNLKEQEEFFSNMSHEFKTPLNVIFSALQILDMHTKQDSRTTKYKKIMKQNCYRLLKLINNLMDISKIDTGYLNLELGNYNIVSIIEDISMSVAEFIEDKGIKLTFDTNVEEKVIACDPDKIERIILNLLSNAIKFTNPGGEINVNVEDEGDLVNITVEDSGIGIPEDKLSLIFERFTQVDKSLKRNHEGSGIGLSLVRSLVEMHGGIITASSSLGKGSKFTISIPSRLVDNYVRNTRDIMASNNIERISLEFSDIYSLAE